MSEVETIPPETMFFGEIPVTNDERLRLLGYKKCLVCGELKPPYRRWNNECHVYTRFSYWDSESKEWVETNDFTEDGYTDEYNLEDSYQCIVCYERRRR